MKINEGKFRSPKWLRNYLDFEVSTGNDITGEPSKKMAKKIERERLKKAAKEKKEKWNRRWVDCDTDEFRSFYKEVYNNGNFVSSYDLKDIKTKWQDNFKIWDDFDKWSNDKKEKERKRKQIEKDLDDLYEELIKDFRNAPYSDKIKTPTINGTIAFHYKFEDGRLFRREDNRIYWGNMVYTVGLIYKAKFINLGNAMIDKGRVRPGGSKGWQSSYNSSSSNAKEKKQANTPPKWKDHPKGPLYQTLKDTIKQREEQIKSATGTDRVALQNELDTAKRMLTHLNKKYQFESNIQNFSTFNKIFEKSKFVTQEEFNELLDKISDIGLNNLSETEKKRLNLFSLNDEPILDIINSMAELTSKFDVVNKKLKTLSSKGEMEEAKKIFREEWGPLNDQMMELESVIREYGIDLGDETFMMLMDKNRADVYGYNPNKEDDNELEMDI